MHGTMTVKKLYAFFLVIPRRLNSDTGELPRRKLTNLGLPSLVF